ncbi:MAG: pyruvate kinase [Saprospiraceae bacterium]|nr:pyruvate kinase [Saprospiraceae bacterium]MCB9343376.1 pyruvate kinase [Lewinellaceae bacterium]
MSIEQIEKELAGILQILIDKESVIKSKVFHVHKDYSLSAKNLYRYLILRSFDLRAYHETLSDIGVSSLRTAEGYVFSNLYNVVRNLNLIQGKAFQPKSGVKIIGYHNSRELLKSHTNNLFNESQKIHDTKIMVTLPDEAAEDKQLVLDMALQGMEIARINLSHGNLEMWQKMVTMLHKVQKETGRNIKIYMDLSGPKIRTAGIEIPKKNGKMKRSIAIKVGDHIILTKKKTTGKKSKFDKHNRQTQLAEVGVLLPEIIDAVQIGDSVLFDDGMISARVLSKKEKSAELEITECHKAKIGSEKGINLPNTVLHLPALTKSDLENLPFVCKHADIVGYSFVRSGTDVRKLYTELAKNNAGNLGVVFKIENREAFENLPEILLEGMKRNKIGVMIARGDLAVEIGFERISEVQEEILWLCEAAHIPVIWATQVLDNLAKTGIPTRSEISDAAHGAQAECVMLNKGPYIIDAIKVLKNVLKRMEAHSAKKKNELRALNVTRKYVSELLITD